MCQVWAQDSVPLRPHLTDIVRERLGKTFTFVRTNNERIMIDPDWPKTITFRIEDVPDMPDIPRYDPEEERRRSAAVADELEEYFGFRPFDVEW